MENHKIVRRVVVVDDQASNGELVKAQLRGVGCEVEIVLDGSSALGVVAERPPDMILLDVQMPALDGFEVCRRLKAEPSTRLIPVVMLTALNQVADRVLALEAGADDFLAKPVEAVELRARVTSLLRLKALYDRLDDTEQVVFALARAVEAKDAYTEAHTMRVAGRAVALGEAIGLPPQQLDQLYRGGLLHDIGKIGVPDHILVKPGPLDECEKELMRRHPMIGEQIARPLRSAAGLLTIIRHHHENFDGTGYPDGLSANAIPEPARIVAISDAYDAMTSERPYRAGRTLDEARAILEDGAGRQWDPNLVGIFLESVVSEPDAASRWVHSQHYAPLGTADGSWQ